MSTLLHELPMASAAQRGDAPALTLKGRTLSYAELVELIDRFATGLIALGVGRGERVAFYLDKRFETVAASFGTTKAGAVFVPVNPLLKGDQVAHILRDCNVRVLVSTDERLRSIAPILAACPDLRHVVVIGEVESMPGTGKHHIGWSALAAQTGAEGHRVIDADMAAILYTSGSTGRPKGVVLSHRNMVAGAKSVASYLENSPADTILSALPLSFDAGFSQLTTAFRAGARVVLLNYLLPRDVLQEMVREKVTGLTAVPPLWIQLVQLEWPAAISDHLRYIANTGGRMPRETLAELRRRLPKTKPFLMYGLTEAFRSTYLPPSEVDRRPDSIGKAIPTAEILVVNEKGELCGPNEPGELVHRGALVGMGYWNDPAKTAERFKPAPSRPSGLCIPELAVWSGDTVRTDEEGFLYFVGRRDEMIKTSGYRVSPTEVEEMIHSTKLVGEVAAIGIPHDVLGQAIVLFATPLASGPLDKDAVLRQARGQMPPYMLPQHIIERASLPRNPNGKIDRKLLTQEALDLLGGGGS
jgi:acyl-CoA ligase (AMP-forming) (exosortase A-associated)